MAAQLLTNLFPNKPFRLSIGAFSELLSDGQVVVPSGGGDQFFGKELEGIGLQHTGFLVSRVEGEEMIAQLGARA